MPSLIAGHTGCGAWWLRLMAPMASCGVLLFDPARLDRGGGSLTSDVASMGWAFGVHCAGQRR